MKIKSIRMRSLGDCLSGILLAALLSMGCHNPGKHPASSSAQAVFVADPSFVTSCPFFTSDAAGRPVLSWVRQDSADGMAKVCYAVYSDSSKTFGQPHVVPPAVGVEPHGEDMPKIIFRKNGSILVVYSVKAPRPDNPYTGAVYYTQSFDGGAHWTPEQPLVKDTALSFDQRYFDLDLLPDGEVGIVWLNNSEPHGSTLYFASTQGDQGFSPGKIIGRHTCQCCRTDLMTDSSGRIHVAWRDILGDSVRDMDYCYSADSGKTFSAPVRISPDNWVVNGCPHTGPSMAMNKDGLHFAWFTMGGSGGIYYCHTDNNGLTFSARQPVSSLASARHPQITAMPDNDLVITWDENAGSGEASHQRIALQMRGPSGFLLNTRYLTPDSINAFFPQLKILDDHSALLAYTEENGEKEQVHYQLVDLQP